MESERHHYLPEYFIKGFGDDQNKLWVYNKEKDEIASVKKSPRQIFFEWNLNTIQNDDLLERTYSKVDSYLNSKIKELINNPDIKQLENDLEAISTLIFFLIDIFFRKPDNQEFQLNILNSMKLNSLISSDHPMLTLEEQVKLVKSCAPSILATKKSKGGKWSYKIIDYKQEEVFVLSDNPIIFRKQPITKDDFADSFVFPLSKSRLFVGLHSTKYNIGTKELKTINLLSIFQAGKYVASSNKTYLQQIVTGYKHWQNVHEHVPNIKREFFNTLNDKTPDSRVGKGESHP